MKLRLLFFLLVAACPLFAQQTATPDETARFLAGLPVRGTPLSFLGTEPAWAEHATEFDKAWAELDARQLAKVRAWGAEFLGDAFTAKRPLFYFFSGPDILYAQAFFPNASTYVLAGLEPVGAIPNMQTMRAAALEPSLAALRKSLNSVLSFSFFITKDMKTDLTQTQLSGTLPLLYVFLARSGSRVETVELVGLDKTGAFAAGKGTIPGAKITFFGPSGRLQTLYYFCTNLANDGIKSSPGFLKFCDGLGAGNSLVKAASYLMHIGEFSGARDFLLTHSRMLVQDDSGIPLRFFEPSRWVVRLFGHYPGPIDIFKQYAQPDLAAAYERSNPPALSFGFGYRWHPSQSSLILASPKGAHTDSSTPPPDLVPINSASPPPP